MGIVNLTPDSFSGDGLLAREEGLEAALQQARDFAAAGADILDIGGESTRPGSAPVSLEEELARVIPLVRALAAENTGCILSVDRAKAEVARQALAAGADWINDVWGLRADPSLAGVVAAAEVPVVLMHNRSKPKDVAQEERLGGRYVGVAYDDLIADIKRELGESIELARQAGVKEANIILDPGVGFGKTVAQNLQIVNQMDQFKTMGFPILLGSSRKSFIGYTLDLPPDERLEGTAATVAIGIARGADIVRVHDVKPIVRLAKMTDAIIRST